MEKTRIEKDSMGELSVPADALYGASTQRAVLNFPISGQRIPVPVIRAYGLLKAAAAQSNRKLGTMEEKIARGIQESAEEIAQGDHDSHFPVDIYQTGSGTSTNMNANEVIANLCHRKGLQDVHPNDHVNLAQSSNDTFPTALHIAASLELQNRLLPALGGLRNSLDSKAREFADVGKIGRTHLMDAVVMTLGQEFSGYAAQIEKAEERVQRAIEVLREVPLGGTAIGTGLNCPEGFAGLTIQYINEQTGLSLLEAKNAFEAQAARDALVEAHGQLNAIATALYKIANDIRLLGSGPRCAIGEIQLPALQPGSSIMPGKVNPVLCEAATMVAARVFGNQTTLTFCGAGGQFELNAMMPLLGSAFLESVMLLTNISQEFGENCVAGITANRERCEELIERSLAMVTPLVPLIGYDRASEIAKQAMKTGQTVRQACEAEMENLNITPEDLQKALTVHPKR